MECSGSGSWRKCPLIKKTLHQSNLGIVFLQETKKSEIDNYLVKSLWSSSHISWASLDLIGASGGILVLRSEPEFSVREVIQGHFYVFVHVLTVDGFSF